MRVAVFSTKPYDREFLTAANAAAGHDLIFLEPRLTAQTARLAEGSDAVCAFVNDDLCAEVLDQLAGAGVRVAALRSAGFNNVDVAAANKLGLTVVRVPEYSPHAVAEHTVGLMLALNRKIHRAHNRVREHNFALTGLLGFDLHGRTVGIVGTGRIGICVAQIMAGFGCRVLASDPYPNDAAVAAGVEYVPLERLLAESHIVTLHCPLTPDTWHLIDAERIPLLHEGAMLINTGRGALVDTRAVIDGLKSGRIGYLGLDVYEEESDLFFEDRSERVLGDDDFARLTTFPNVLITGHQAFFTEDGLRNIAATTIGSLTAIDQAGPEAVPTPARVC
ncbi:2-hydroxyacid dehydrogenase [Micromonospora sp. WMMD1082]|uniref:2-hydroxyacid dehydrogenase n=1 Tax=Micromonospora sp. WMMD1082 TaxID=3016104 RepID=UPI0024173D4A|nr:2-hydroxyacid dehydrogenase [Micromonospora sp. WMMD1082]MDG4792984.1 2-hydroxyacid dehydrogenase [Micromonospora sp. WMMD1082]